MTPPTIERAKEMAARKALMTYAEEVHKACQELGISFCDLRGTEHIHTALLINDEDESVTLLRAHWVFSVG